MTRGTCDLTCVQKQLAPVSGSNLHVYIAGRCSSEVSAGRLVQVRKSKAGRALCAPPTEVHPMHSTVISDRLVRLREIGDSIVTNFTENADRFQ